jgi:hypothetical protein
MSELAAYCEARRTTRVEPVPDPAGLLLKLTTDYDSRQYGETDLTLTIKCPRRPASVSVRSADGGSTAPVSHYCYEQEAGNLIVNVSCRAAVVVVEI